MGAPIKEDIKLQEINMVEEKEVTVIKKRVAVSTDCEVVGNERNFRNS